MILTAAQQQTLKTDISANGDTNALKNASNGDVQIAALYNALAVADFFVYRSNVPVQDIYDQITWANLTPVDPVPTDTALNAAIWQARSLACQGKQFNVQIILQGQNTINAAKINVRAGLQDALTNVPSGAGGALISGGWVGVRDNALARKALRIEKLFATVGGAFDGTTAAKSGTLVFEGTVSAQQISDVLRLP